MPASIGFYRYHGLDRRGTGWSGATDEPPAKFIQKRYEKGWREMTMTATDDGSEVGGIGVNDLSGRRLWWAEGRP